MIAAFCRHKNKRIAYRSKLRTNFDMIYFCPDCSKYAEYNKDLDRWSFWRKNPFRNLIPSEWSYVEESDSKGCSGCIYSKYCGERTRSAPCSQKITSKEVEERLHMS